MRYVRKLRVLIWAFFKSTYAGRSFSGSAAGSGPGHDTDAVILAFLILQLAV